MSATTNSGGGAATRDSLPSLVTHPTGWYPRTAPAGRPHGKTDGLESNSVEAVLRRTILGTAAPIGADAALNPTHPDAELIAVCAEFLALERCIWVIYEGPNPVEDDDKAELAATPLWGRQDELLDRMQELRATTPDGIQARVHALADHAAEFDYSFDGRDTRTGRMLDYIMRDSLLVAGSPVRLRDRRAPR